MPRIRPATLDDLSAIYDIALATGDAGRDARARHPDPRIVGDLFAVPYLHFASGLCFVLDQDGRVLGYCVGTGYTGAYEDWLEATWWPRLQNAYPKPPPGPSSDPDVDAQWRSRIHTPVRTPEGLARRFPGHLHLNVLPQAQGLGAGKRLLTAWIDAARAAGVPAAHVGVDPRNAKGLIFWEKHGFRPVPDLDAAGLWLGRDL